MDICQKIEQRIAEEGVDVLRDDQALARHASGCPRCSALLRRLAALDTALNGLPVHDAPDTLVERVIEQVGETEPVTK